eukprot:TRINITY_DN237_c0_g1_i1.p1 TRINITY_DN237_c0_g1~~TRINITY_DN237_c0_g1_i1.p1  ORF type:complete len:495 (+),score=203.12 TRINITY_DN237_c0_g1_i1:29-1513(+)
MIRRPPRSTQSRSSAASDVYKRQVHGDKQKTRIFKEEPMKGTVTAIVLLVAFTVLTEAVNNYNDLKNNFKFEEKVKLDNFPNKQSHSIYSGYIKVRDSGSSLFYHLYTPLKGNDLSDTAPLIIFFEGVTGAGVSTILHPVTPYFASKKEGREGASIEERSMNWNQNHFILLIDQPLGTGYSVVAGDDKVKSASENAKDLTKFFTRFFEIYPNFLQGRIFLFGSGAAGHLIPKLYDNFTTQGWKVAGVGLNAPWIDPYHQLNFDEAAYATGLYDAVARDSIRQRIIEEKIDLLNNARDNASINIQYILAQTQLLGQGIDPYSWNRHSNPKYQGSDFGNASARQIWGASEAGKKAYNVPSGIQFKESDPDVYLAYLSDWTKFHTDIFNHILTNSKLLLWTGVYDLVHNPGGLNNWIRSLNIIGKEWATSRRQPLSFLNNVVGNVKVAGNLWFAVIYEAGAYLEDQGAAIESLLTDFIRGRRNFMSHFTDSRSVQVC